MKLNKFDGSYSGWIPVFCVDCRRLGGRKKDVPICSAYPNGIPLAIWRNKDFDHNPCTKFEERDDTYTDDIDFMEDI